MSPNRRVATILKSVHVNMSQIISEIMLRSVVFLPKRFGDRRKKKMRRCFNIKAATDVGLIVFKKLCLNL